MKSLVKLAAMGAAAVVAVLGASAPAEAHGEKSQQAFLRMRTLNWYDVKWSKTTVNVNEDMVLSGKVHVFSAWPQAVANPREAFLNAGEPGPVLVRTAQFIGDEFAPRSFSMVPGNDYAFSINLRGRRAGRWHVHAQINVQSGGPIIGPGQWIEIKGDMKEFTDPVQLLDGTTIDLEHYGIDRVYLWHLPWLAIGAAWIFFWFMRKGIVSAYLRVAEGREDAVDDDDRRVGAIALALTILATIAGYAMTNSAFPRTIPLQAGLQKPLTPLSTEGTAGVGKEQVSAELHGGVYKVPGRELTINVQVKNNTSEPLRLGEYTAAGLRFLNPDVFTTKPEFPDYLLADRGLSTEATPIAPGESKEIVVKIQDARWDIERLSDLAYDTDSQIGGLLFFFSPSGRRFAAEIGGPVIPKFVAGDMP
jgi:methane/ammonia monooxygenase subunit B